jgi:hypothetical protein
MKDACIKFKFVKFDSQVHPWPKEINPWSKEKYQPRDCSWGWVDCDGKRVHILHGDYILKLFDINITVIKSDKFDDFVKFIKNDFAYLLSKRLYG